MPELTINLQNGNLEIWGNEFLKDVFFTVTK